MPGVREDLLHTCKPHKKKTPHTACRRTHTCESKHCGQAGKRCPDARTAGGKFERRKVWNRTTEAEFVIFDDFNLFSRGASVRYVWVLVNAELSLMIHACIKDTLELFFLFFLILINADCEESWAVEDRYIHSTVRFKDECGSWISFHAAVQTHVVVFCFKSVTSGGKKTQREREKPEVSWIHFFIRDFILMFQGPVCKKIDVWVTFPNPSTYLETGFLAKPIGRINVSQVRLSETTDKLKTGCWSWILHVATCCYV